ncbi:type II toxin-antitoxin system PemK/MazF family toxin [Modestobacter sp. I12A-02628]|uniref:Type II toxin-antitoxin system PemK/MazF family toxin n=1 Tax=Goekera deserti TaxID=2497753 RepID=A0A7K3WEG9_9ACTN|nr:type II toxin-antitoxin system PemK/MazF family toxin [Goekera deserti]MPQ98079.1 type II toxin-antitoxin system PemK/MazF family toxin [Goekera deserti]NDI48726.1 type II toxin-antitoxin system PemK/MazF family toxin [Goekera deserti]NEL54895.1 type II toxin-antitoxin system PemK/MazF family toxin [Goekera deserti]
MATGGFRAVLGRALRAAAGQGARAAMRELEKRSARPPRQERPRPAPRREAPPSRHPAPRPGPATAGSPGPVALEYRPRDDGLPDPGEVVWAWVPYEEGDGRGKDRPVLVIARSGGDLLALMLTSKDHDRDARDEARHGRHWIDVGTGGWDRQGRPSEVRVDRLITLDPGTVRREGATLDRERYEQVAAEVRRVHGW